MDLDFIDQEAREKYTIRRKQDLERCRQFLATRDFDGIQTIGHNLKGNGISFGFPELSTLGERLELAAKASNLDQAKTLIDSFEVWIQGQGQKPISH